MAEDARQKITKIEKASLIASESVIKPEKSNGLFTYIPAFIVGFFLTFLLSNFLSLPANIKSIIHTFEVSLLVSAMVAIGCKINVKALISQSSKALLWGLLIWLLQLIILMSVLFYMVRL